MFNLEMEYNNSGESSITITKHSADATEELTIDYEQPVFSNRMNEITLSAGAECKQVSANLVAALRAAS